MWGLKRPQSINKLLLKQCLPVITWNKKHLSKQTVKITYALFAVVNFEDLGVISCQRD